MSEIQGEFPDLAIGIDLGATKTVSVLISKKGEIIERYQSLTNTSEDPHTVLETITNHIKKYQQIDYSERIIGIGIGTPGWHDLETGQVVNAVNIGWKNFNFVSELKAQLSDLPPIFHQTDAIAETLGEYYYGTAQGYTDFVYLGIGSGFGSGFFCNNALVVGSTGMAGGIGHYAFGTSQNQCVCGLYGCIEQHVGGIALTAILNQLSGSSSVSNKLKKNQFTDHYAVISAADENDPLAVMALSEMGKWLGIAMSMYITLLNPRLIVIGGGLGLASYSLIVPIAIKEAKNRTLSRYWEKLEIKKSTVMSSAIGAACLVWKYLRKGGD